MRSMHAVRAHARGGPEVLVYEDAPRPEPGPGEVLLAVRAASVTANELRWEATWTDSFDGTGHARLPVIPSHEVAGVVADAGPGVAGVGIGDAVYGLIPFTHDGAAAEYVSLPADILAAKPVNLDYPAAAAVPLAALTAWQALVVHAGLRPGQHVLIHGAAGGVGSFAVQIAAALGARVIATASAMDAGFVADLGAAEVIDHRTQRFEEHVRDMDAVLDIVGGETQRRSWSVLRRGGVLVSLAEPIDSREADAHRARGVFFIVEPNREHLRQITRLIESGQLAPVVDQIVPLAETRAAYEALEHTHRRGKIVIEVAA
ncbi:NADP-dependent oxidoreductase [Gandjariella thermophila]|uniref:Oxidoreductase n=1 Tax=Gandjariella thermophila TaxID=1931992 RepID=A0A4D4J828_9PSEU|nr:NADP-dependent oxidoreductase [Gandjariella thermophila]GDY31674.1 oxidoreductase [Gandjariella thermophila]